MTSPGVMRFQTGIKVFCKTGIESFLIDLGLQDINIIELHPPSPNGFGATDFALLKLRSEYGVPGRSSRRAVARAQRVEMPGTIARLRLKGFGAAYFASLKVRSEVWWRRRESNPRPRTFRQSFYIHSLCFKFALPISRRQDSRRTSL